MSFFTGESDTSGEDPAGRDEMSWVTIARPTRTEAGESPLSMRRVVAQLVPGIVVVLAVWSQ